LPPARNAWARHKLHNRSRLLETLACEPIFALGGKFMGSRFDKPAATTYSFHWIRSFVNRASLPRQLASHLF
jgi:hypothetical protein